MQSRSGTGELIAYRVGMSDPQDLKTRSHEVTDFPNRAPARAMLRAIGMTDDDWDKPQVGVVSSWNEVTPCNMPLDRLAKRSKEGVREAGGYPIEFNTIAVSDGISMGHEGMRASLVSREVIADSVETVMHAERFDAMVNRIDLTSARDQKINVIGIIGNDAAWMQIRRGQEQLYGTERSVASALSHTRYDRVVEALGGHGEYVEKARDIRPALERAIASGKPALVNIKLGRSDFRKDSVSV